MNRSAPFLLLLLAAGCQKAAPPPPPPHAALVVAGTAAAADVPQYLDEIGRCVAQEHVAIQPQVSGRITGIHFADGADVKAGALLFTIDPRPYQAKVAAAEANLAQSRAVLELAKLEFDRANTLLGKKALSQQEFDTSKNAVTVAEARIQQNQAALEAARIDLDYCTIKSPIDGRAGHRLVDLGNVVAANSGSLLDLQKFDPIYADFTVTENDFPTVQKSQSHGTLRVEVRLPDDSAEPRSGDLTFIDNAVQSGTGTVRLRATVANADRRFWPGQFIRARLILAQLKGAVLIPAEATQLSPTGPFVYVIKPDDTAELRPVTLGQKQGNQVVVEKGLAAGDRIVVQGHLGVMPGGKVQAEAPKSPAPEHAKP
ncbi:MAG: efflux RND transporter periplasmic adaptor subunit [Planctomycetaceae bacterium]|nr:efflux RND transporter periplasmic adaptor subunit [Planctomycetaceae bacterium]